MSLNLEQQESNLVYFLHERWGPDIEATQENTEPRTAPLYNRVALLEGYLLLRLGVKCSFFPRDPSTTVVQENFSILRSVYRAVVKSGDDRLFRENVRRLLSRLEVTDSPPEFEQSRSDERADTLFRSLMSVSNQVTSDLASRAIFEELAFDNPKEWDKTIEIVQPLSQWARNKRKTEALLGSKEYWEKDSATRERFISGFISVLQFMEAYWDIAFSAGMDPHQQTLDDFVEISEWRLNFKDDLIRKRFGDLSEGVISCIVSDDAVKPFFATESQLISEITRDLKARIRILMTQWGAPPLSMHMGSTSP